NLRHVPCTAKFLLLTLVAGLAFGLISCRRSDRPVFPATGKVFYKGKPAEGARVTFVSLTDNDAKKPKPGAEVGPDGEFRLSTYASYDGAPPGSYAVLIVYPSPAKKVDEENAGPDLLQGCYADPKTTPLRAEIKQGTNDLEAFNVR
ncbi:MAG: hypothetical protein WAU84_04205, partial [Thermoguttaceae bacterium]